MIVFDSSTLILLAKIELLKETSREIKITVTPEVKNETTRKKVLFDAQLIGNLIEQKIIKVEEVREKGSIERLKGDFNIAGGEASSLILAKKKGFILATDDGSAIKAAKILGVDFTTTIDFLVRTYEKGILTREIALVKLEKLRRYGRYTSRIIEDAAGRLKGGLRHGSGKRKA